MCNRVDPLPAVGLLVFGPPPTLRRVRWPALGRAVLASVNRIGDKGSTQVAAVAGRREAERIYLFADTWHGWYIQPVRSTPAARPCDKPTSWDKWRRAR